MGYSSLSSILLILAITSYFAQPVQGNVIGFDFGSTFFKITLVKPGQPFTIVENTATKRKTETWLTITSEERYFGVDSLTESTKHPKTSFSQLHRFVGQEYDSQKIDEMTKSRFLVNEFAEDDRGLVGWKLTKKFDNGTEEDSIMYTEELIAQLLKYGRQMSEKQAGGTIKDCVITIPSYYTPSQRRMILDSADIAGLSVLQLLHENTAAATMFGIDRLDTEKPLTVLFYNMGGMDTEVSVVRYSAITETPSNKSYEHIEILAESYDKELGGQDFDLVLLNMIADRFNNLKERKGKADIRTNDKAIKRLMKEVIKIKDILSANKQNQIKIGELQDYVSLLTTIERKEFEDASQHLFDRVMAPVQEVLEKAGLTIEDIDQVELLGGGIRIPKIQELIQTTLKKSELGVHLNGDEAMCFGSAFIASNSSASFKVRKVYLTVHPQTQFSIHITPLNTTKSEGSTQQQDQNEQIEDNEDGESEQGATPNQQIVSYEKNYILYKKSDYLGQKKSLSLTYDTDMKIDIYAEDGDQKTKVATFTVQEIDRVAQTAALQNGTTLPKVALSFELTRSGLIQLNKAEAKVEETYTVQEKVPTPKSAKNKTKSVPTAAQSSNDTSNTTESAAEGANTTSSEEVEEPVKPTEPQYVTKTKKRTIPFPLSKIDREYYGIQSLSNDQLRTARERLRWFEKRDEDKAKTDKAKNDFESVIYSLRDWVNEDENVPFVGTGKIDEIMQLLRDAEDWLENDGYSAKYGEYITRFSELNTKYNQVKMRKDEFNNRDGAVTLAKSKLESFLDKIEDLKLKKTWITEDQRQDLIDKVNDTLKWLEEQLENQKEKAIDEDPAFKISELETKVKRVDQLYDRLKAIPKPKDTTTGKKKKKKLPKNIKIDNMTFDGNSGMNIEDLINIQGGYEEEDEEETTQEQQQKQEQSQDQQKEQTSNEQSDKKPYDASEEDL
ncbi:protein heat shock protein [Stylonychia lemnae]|uniref:Protein heat shock protein n=1 Tax=Stylonychia lemnae TaxID=5949 RepID=A0A077ZWU3_STYLE|nr:protein heat shock protein [Stylonychia lemnae]|eukprot:CDW74071.1 protein heat shock protein [Stylonychia lemnae]